MEQLDREMLHILSMDSRAHVGYSEYVHLWYVHLNLEKGGDGILRSVGGSHANTPEDAVHGCFEALKEIQPTKEEPWAVIVKDAYESGGKRKHYRWNGACFAEVPATSELASSES